MPPREAVKMSRFLVLCAALAAAVAACGGNPSGPSGAVVLHGTVVSDARGSASASSERAPASSGPITVMVEEYSDITATVAADGTFELTGLPGGDFTLVFIRDG